MKLIKKILFGRAAFVFIAIAMQLLVLIGVIQKFNDYFVLFYAGCLFVSMAAVLWVINKKGHPIYKIAWIIPILLFPIFGGIFYIFFGGNKLSRRERRKMKSIEEKTRGYLAAHNCTLNKIRAKNEAAAVQSSYIQNYAYCPPWENTTAEYFPIGETKFERLKEELKKAEHYIFLEYFIIEEGVMWNSILDILVKKASMGVDVRVIYDDIGCLLTLPKKYNEKLEDMGIRCCIFNPLIPVLSPRFNTRDHRKIAVIDGHTGFTGGINLADEYINGIQKHGHWKDTAIMLKGEAVWSLTVMFLSNWDYLRGIDEDFNIFRKNTLRSLLKNTGGYIQPFADNPLDDEPVGEIVYLNLINKAREYVYITTPYLIIDDKMITALSSAAKGGVDIRIITPHLADKWFVHEVTRFNYKALIESGVKIYEYIPGFIHSKTFTVDDEYGVVGTINMDYRSLYLHFECGVWMYDSNCIADMKDDFLHTLNVCRQISLEDFKDIKWNKRLMLLLLRAFAPLM